MAINEEDGEDGGEDDGEEYELAEDEVLQPLKGEASKYVFNRLAPQDCEGEVSKNAERIVLKRYIQEETEREKTQHKLRNLATKYGNIMGPIRNMCGCIPKDDDDQEVDAEAEAIKAQELADEKKKDDEEYAKYLSEDMALPPFIRIGWSDRNLGNKLLYIVYRLFRISFVSFWFYFIPFFVSF